MKSNFRFSVVSKSPFKIAPANRLAYQTVICLAALACASAASAQTNTPPAVSAGSGGSTNVTTLPTTEVNAQLDTARSRIVTDTGASTYTLPKEQIEAIPGGANAAFNQVELRMPGMAEDSLGQVHLRGEHANIQYRINDVLLPEGITGFGPELDTRYVESIELITGSLPAEYGLRTAGIMDIRTKSGTFDQGGDFSIYGGSFDTYHPSFAYGGSEGKLNYYFDGDYLHDDLGIENPTPSAHAIHDATDQYKFFSYLSYLPTDTSRLSVILSASYSSFQIPDSPGLPPGTSPNGDQWVPGAFNSANLDDRQDEQNYYGVVAYQQSLGDLNYQVAAFGRSSEAKFLPDPTGDLFFNGVASDVDRTLYTGGLQGDFSYDLAAKHTLRGGFTLWRETATDDSTTTVFPVDGAGNPTGPSFPIAENILLHGTFAGVYLQDEWKATDKLTVNYGVRWDIFSSYITANQVSPRVNAVYQATDSTTLHAGYSRYFTPPPLELVANGNVARFNGTSNSSGSNQDDPVVAERAHYFDIGVSQKVLSGLTVGVDGYYKIAHNELDDGFFGQTLILSPFNYRVSTIEGVELTANYTMGGFSTYANLALSDALGKDIDSAQFLLPDVAAYTQNHLIHLDHDQRITGSFGASYMWKQEHSSTRAFVDALYGSGLRQDGTGADDTIIPNGASVGPYYTLSLGLEEKINIGAKQFLKARIETVNVTDNSYPIRTGSGVGVNASQYGERFGLFGSLSYSF